MICWSPLSVGASVANRTVTVINDDPRIRLRVDFSLSFYPPVESDGGANPVDPVQTLRSLAVIAIIMISRVVCIVAVS